MTEQPDPQFNQADLDDLAKAFQIAELEETITVCSYVELAYPSARMLIDYANAYRAGDFSKATVLIEFALDFADNTALCLSGEGMLPE